jgi:glutamine---fructose-6-phosphate transaminase (isomerizing)
MRNAHPHVSRDGVAVVHNGIIENHDLLRAELKDLGYSFSSETDTEVVAHRIHQHLASSQDLFGAVRKTVGELQGAYALAVVCERDPDCIVLARAGCPVVVGLGIDENFVASDVAALLPVTRRFCFSRKATSPRSAANRSASSTRVGREVASACARASCPRTPSSAANTGISCSRRYTSSRARSRRRSRSALPAAACSMPRSARRRSGVRQVKAVHIAACGTSYHAGLAACYFLEQICRIPARIEFASEYRYRNPVVTPGTLFVTISQSGETADTLAALRTAKNPGICRRLTICNVAESSMVRESELVLLTRAGLKSASRRPRHSRRSSRRSAC